MILKPAIMDTINDKNGFQSFLNACDFSERGLLHLDMYCTLIIEA